MDELNKFYQTVMQDVVAMQSGDEDGDTQEQIFTRICQEMLSEAGEQKIVIWLTMNAILVKRVNIK